MAPVKVKIKPLHAKLGTDIPLPSLMSLAAAGIDLAAVLDEPVCLEPGGRALIPCGFAMELPIGYEAQLRPRSGLALRHGLTLPNTPGTIDADYRGEIKVILMNLGKEAFVVESGMRIAQMVVMPVPAVKIVVVDALNASARGGDGFGSTGLKSKSG